MLGSLLFAVLSITSSSVYGHKTPQTSEEKQAYRDLQAAAYHCAPTVAVYTAERQRAFAQHILGTTASHTLAADDLFVNGAYDDLEDATGVQKYLACNAVEEAKIRKTNNTCVLAPEVTMGPYYETREHIIRSNIAEYEPGLLFLMNIGVIDVETCEPIPNILVDLWHANATGHYASHPEPAEHLKDEEPVATGPRRGLLSPFPKTAFGETFLRGALPTDKNGVSQFTSIFPGYYTGRATHVHVKVHPEWEVHENKTFTSGRLAHIGQFFVEDDLNMAVDKLWPYNTNPIAQTRGRTRNWVDSLNVFQESQLGGYVSTFETHLLGGVLQQGIIGYITIGINASASHSNVWHI